ncbi:MAG: helix-turn-helix domain-containing protein [Clostridiales bacterium]|nr:helix-turn-helix domain-containing protein [Clostridiales bacterium]
MGEQIQAIAQRLSMLREAMDISAEDMAAELNITAAEYLEYEEGKHDFAFSFLFGCANKLGVDIVDLLTGETPKLTYFSLVRKGEGLNIDRRKEYKYQHMAFFFRQKKAEPFHVTVTPEDNTEMHLNSHEGQEFNFILKGSMRIKVDAQETVLHEGDAVYYDSSRPHGMVCEGDEPCEFLAIIMK